MLDIAGGRYQMPLVPVHTEQSILFLCQWPAWRAVTATRAAAVVDTSCDSPPLWLFSVHRRPILWASIGSPLHNVTAHCHLTCHMSLTVTSVLRVTSHSPIDNLSRAQWRRKVVVSDRDVWSLQPVILAVLRWQKHCFVRKRTENMMERSMESSR